MGPHTEILIAIRKLVRSINLESKRIQKEFGISIPQLLCLGFLRSCENYQSTHKELTRFLHLNSSTVTGIVNRLEKKTLITRTPFKADKRITGIALTPAGLQLLASSPDLLHEKLKSLLASLPENNINAIRDSLLLMVNALGLESIDAAPLLTIDDPLEPAD